VLLSGGCAYAVLSVAPHLPPFVRGVIKFDLRTVYGWSTFEACFNPLWIAGLTLVLVTLKPLLQTGVPRTLRDVVVGSAGFCATYLVHPYSAVMIAAITLGAVVSTAVDDVRAAWRQACRIAVTVLPGALVCVLVAAWQRQDPAFQAASGGFFGDQDTPIFWYPITLAGVGFFALRGIRAWARESQPWCGVFVGWVGAVAVLHSSNLVNGYHFLFGLHLPVAIVAAGPVATAWRARGGRPAIPIRAGLLALLFGAPIATTVIDVRSASEYRVAAPVAELLKALGAAPEGNVLAPAYFGNLIPAYGPHRVFVGQWFLTPDYDRRSALYEQLVADPRRERELIALVLRERFRYVVVPELAAQRITKLLPVIAEPVAYGPYVLLRLW
jgi:hypothetical protein